MTSAERDDRLATSEPADESEGDASAAPLRRVQNPGRLVAFIVATAVVVGAAFVVGGLVKSPQDEALVNVDADVEVLAHVEERVVSDTFALPAVLVAGATTDVFISEAPREASSVAPPAATSPDEAESAPPSTVTETTPSERAVVSRMAVSNGKTVKYGDLLGEVSGRPVFAWPASVPLFRDIVVGTKGSDVTAVQQALSDMGYSVTVDGAFGAATLNTLQLHYRKAGYELPFVSAGVRGLSWRELIGIPTGDGVVQATAAVGSLLGAEAPLLTVRTAPPALEAQATAVEIEQLAKGAQVGVTLAGAAPVTSTVVFVGGFATDEETGASGYPVRIALPEGVTVDASTAVQIGPAATVDASLAVPTSAVRQEGAASYVLVPNEKSGKDEPPFTRVDIVVAAQADGWVAIQPNDALPVGADVLVSP